MEIADLVSGAVLGRPVDHTGELRPRERKPLPVRFQVMLVKDEEGESLRWTFAAESLNTPDGTAHASPSP
jgi:hypothetical protein